MTKTIEDYILTPEEERSWHRWRLGIDTLDALENRGPITPEDHYLIPGVLSTHETLVYGQSKVGKSFLVSQIVASVVDGRKFLDRKPYRHGLNVLVIATDGGSRDEYQQRLSDLDSDASRIHLMQVNGGLSAETWTDLYAYAEDEDIGLVVLDHATDVVEGDINHREGWRDIWHKLRAFGVATLLVSHSTDSKFEGATNHRPSGSAAATQYARARVYIWAPGELDNPKREVRLLSNNAAAEALVCIRGQNGYLQLDEEATTTKQQRSTHTVDVVGTLVDLALHHAPPGSQDEVLDWLSKQEGVETATGGRMSSGTIRNKLRTVKTIEWSKSHKCYVKKN